MSIYFIGCFLIVVMNLAGLIRSIFEILSLKAKNLKKINLHYNIVVNSYQSERQSRINFIFTIVDMLFITPFFSWAYIVYWLFKYAKLKFNKIEVPEKIKEINFKLATMSLEKGEVKSLMDEISSFYGKPIEGFDDDDSNKIILESGEVEGEWRTELTLNKFQKQFKIYMRTPDYDYQRYTTYEYKFVGNNLFVRVVEKKHEHMGDREPDYDIRDNVVLENKITEQCKKNSSILLSSPEEQIGKLKNEVEWNVYNINQIKYFIMSKHSEIYKENEFRRYIRSELERINIGMQKLKEFIENNGGTIDKSNNYNMVDFKNADEAGCQRMKKLIDNPETVGISYLEFESADKIKGIINNYLVE